MGIRGVRVRGIGIEKGFWFGIAASVELKRKEEERVKDEEAKTIGYDEFRPARCEPRHL